MTLDASEYKRYEPWLLPINYYNPLRNRYDDTIKGLATARDAIKSEEDKLEILSKNGIQLLESTDFDDLVYKTAKLSFDNSTNNTTIAGLNLMNSQNQDAEWLNARRDSEKQRINQLKTYYFNKSYNIAKDVSDVAKYMRTHQVWKPIIELDAFEKVVTRSDLGEQLEKFAIRAQADIANSPLKRQVQKENKKQLENSQNGNSSLANALLPLLDKQQISLRSQQNAADTFVNFTYCPTIYGERCVPPLVFHNTVSISDNVYIFGGLECLKTTNFDSLDLSKIKIKGPDYPFPLKSLILNNPMLVANQRMLVFNSETNIVVLPEVSGDVPPPLCCATATVVTHRYIFYYGGFELVTKRAPIQPEAPAVVYLDRELKVNGRCWIYDVVLHSFTEISLVDKSAEQPITFPRFGHSTTALGLRDVSFEESSYGSLYNYEDDAATTVTTATADSLGSRPTTDIDHETASFVTEDQHSEYNARSQAKNNYILSLFVFGGYAYDEQTNQFKCLSYNWRIDLRVTSTSINGYLIFKKKALASVLPSLNQGPLHRGFHAAVLCDDSIVEQAKNNSFAADESGVLLRRYQSFAKRMENKSILIHGGSNLYSTFGDLWKYSFDLKKWKKLKLSTSAFNDDGSPVDGLYEAQYAKANHQMIQLDKYILFIAGFSEDHILENLAEVRQKNGVPLNFKNDEHLPDIAPIASKLSTSGANEHIRLIMLDLVSNTWIFSRCRHKLPVYCNLKDFVTNDPDLQKQLEHALEGNCELELKQLLTSGTLGSAEAVKKVYLTLRANSLITTHTNTLGSASCFSNGRVISVGGILLANKDNIRPTLEMQALLDNEKQQEVTDEHPLILGSLLSRGNPVGALINLELPIYTKGYSNPFKDDTTLYI